MIRTKPIQQCKAMCIKRGVSAAFRQGKRQKCANRVEPCKLHRVAHHRGRTRDQRLDCEGAHMIREARAPCRLKLRSNLQMGGHFARGATPQNPHETALLCRENFKDGGRFPMAPRREQYTFCVPFHQIRPFAEAKAIPLDLAYADPHDLPPQLPKDQGQIRAVW